MTDTRPEPQFWSRWRSAFFAPVGDGQRRRRGSDGLRLASAALALLCCLLVIHFDSRVDRAITQVLHPPPRSITWLVTVVYQAGSFGVIAVLVIAALLACRWVIARSTRESKWMTSRQQSRASAALATRSPSLPRRRRCPSPTGAKKADRQRDQNCCSGQGGVVASSSGASAGSG